MLKVFWIILSLFLIILITIRIPNNGGLTNFTIKNNLLGSPNSAEKFLNNLTWLMIISYLFLAIIFNILAK
jgi:protein translocase SecG subunit|uniref:Probable protein-export membrane protein SecG n=1 Tax=Coscinodiscus radiatus TaxID=33642 RepID=A0A023HA40_9STRA|nr:preprotein-translocase subunit g [Coscinodiscus radiatus]AGH28421.1 preprotein-translocase subunit g [Coscinodiscus radiatus]